QMIRQVRSFARRHGLMGANGKPLALALANLRTTGLTLAHVALGHDVLKTQVLANHASPDTTRRYIDRPVVQAAQPIELGRLQARFVKAIQSGDLSLQSKRGEAPIISAQNAKHPASSVPIRLPASRQAKARGSCAPRGSAASPAPTP